MDKFVLINILFSMIATTSYHISIYRDELAISQFYCNKFHPEKRKNTNIIISEEINHVGEILFLMIIEGIILTIGYLILFFLHSDIPWLTAIFETGIHIPFFLMFYGILIKFVYKLHIKNKRTKPLDAYEIEELTVGISVIILLSFIGINWKLSFFILSIVLGKYIWIDTVLEEKNIIEKLRIILEKFRVNDRKINVLFVCRTYAVNFLFDCFATNMIYFMFKKEYHLSGCGMIMCMIAVYLVILSGYFIAGRSIKNSKPS